MRMDHSNITSNLVYIIELLFYIESVLIPRYRRIVQIPVHIVLLFGYVAFIHVHFITKKYSDTNSAYSI